MEGPQVENLVTIVDTQEGASKLIAESALTLAEAFFDTLKHQVECEYIHRAHPRASRSSAAPRRPHVPTPPAASTAELQALDKATHLVGSQYSEVKDNLSDLETFYTAYAAQMAALRPHLEHIDSLSAVVGQLEESARTLDGQTKQLEAAIADILL
jgi:hypothetical protein